MRLTYYQVIFNISCVDDLFMYESGIGACKPWLVIYHFVEVSQNNPWLSVILESNN